MKQVDPQLEAELKLLELKLKLRTTPPFYWPDANVGLQYFLSWAIVTIVGFVIYQLMGDTLKLLPEQRDLLMIVFGVVLACFKDSYGFTFGSSAGQKKQGEAISKSLEDKDKIIASNVDKTAEVAATAAASVATAAATVAAPAAAKVAAPPAAAEAAPPAVDAALREAGIDPHPNGTDPQPLEPKVVIAWWSLLSNKEQTDLSLEALVDPLVAEFVKTAKVGKATVDSLNYLVGKNLLTQERADELKNEGE